MYSIKNLNNDIIYEGNDSIKILAEKNKTNLRGANLLGADLRGANLLGADLRGANLQGAYLRRANLQGAYLRRANLQNADLMDANLQNAHLQGAILQGADLQGAILQGADLQGAILQGADLQGADLQGADLQGAILQNANLRGANLTNVKGLTKIIGVEPGNCYWKRFYTGLKYHGYQYFIGLNVLPKDKIFVSDERILWPEFGFCFASRLWCVVNHPNCSHPLEARIRIPLDAKINEPWATGGKAWADKIEILQVFDTKTGREVGINLFNSVQLRSSAIILKFFFIFS
jgi:hypothetical protein